jgi:CRISPR system Cascade subunit CasD
MTMPESNTLFLRLCGPMQAWGTSSRLQLRRSDRFPSKSGVIGLILCAMGVRREEAGPKLESLASLRMGVRIDQPGVFIWDYHTAGAGIGIRQAKGGIKFTATTKQPEAQLSRRQYLCDASFLVAWQGDARVIHEAATALQDPVWPIFLGRKSCVPTEPVFAGTGTFADLRTAMEAYPWIARTVVAEDTSTKLDGFVEHGNNGPVPPDALLVYDVPRTLQNPSHGARWIARITLEVATASVPISSPDSPRRWVNYASDQWRQIRAQRLRHDHGLCVFCKSAAEDVHHVTYERAGRELIEDLRSLCKICHDACTQLEYGRDLRVKRIDPSDPDLRESILKQVERLIHERRLGVRRDVREATQAGSFDFLAQAPGSVGKVF